MTAERLLPFVNASAVRRAHNKVAINYDETNAKMTNYEYDFERDTI